MERVRDRAIGRSTSFYWRVRQIFAAGTDGAVYDISNLAALNQTSTGTTPVTAVTDPVGLMLDAHHGLALGAELVDTMNTAAAWTASGTNTVEQDGDAVKITYVDNAAGALALLSAAAGLSSNLTVGANYKVTGYVKINSGSANLVMTDVGETAVSVFAFSSTSYVPFAFVYNAKHATTDRFRFGSMSAGEIVWIKNISFKPIAGNHAIQATAAARPTWTNRVNQLLSSEAFNNATDWTPAASSITPNAAVAPDGSTTMDKVVEDSATSSHSLVVSVASRPTIVAANHVTSVYAKAAGRNRFTLYNNGTSGVVVALFDLAAGTVVSSGGAALVTAGIEAVGNGIYRCWYQFLATAGTSAPSVYLARDSHTGITLDSYAGDGVSGIYIWGAQLNTGATLSRYQRITTATDFDTAGFPYYLSFLGVDDCLTSATGGGGSAGFFFCCAAQPTGGEGTSRILFSDRVVASFNGYAAYLNITNKLTIAGGNGASYTTKLSTASVDVGAKYLLTVWDDGTNLNVQIGNAAAETVARPVVVAGAAGYALGKEQDSASNFFIGNLYASVYVKDSGLTAAQRASVQAWVKSQAGL